MLRHAVHNAVITQSSSFLSKAVAIEVVASLRSYSASSSLSPPAVPKSQQQQHKKKRQQRQLALPAQRRPHSINGQTVPFHVKDLLSHHFKHNATAAVAPKPIRQYDSDLVVVLDMDECLIHSQFLNSPTAAQVYSHQLFQKRRASAATNSQVDSFRFTLPDGELVHVNIRPGLHDFLQKVCNKFETHIFTAAVPVYADPLLDTLDPDNTLFAGRWYRDSCTYDANQQAHVKNLNKLPISQLDRAVLVDNNPLSFLANPNNGILVSSFYNDANDDTLATVWELLQALDNEQDVRPRLSQMFGLEDLLQQPEMDKF